MKFLQTIRITDFRSLAQVDLADLDDIVPFVGGNGSGKSNIFRALNLFFNEAVEEGEPLDLRRDFREPARKVKKVVVVEADLDFGTDPRKELKDVLDDLAGGASAVTLRKTYSLDPVTELIVVETSIGPVGSEPGAVVDERRSQVQRLMSSIQFRYIPNHVHPSELLRQEGQNIRRMLFARLSKAGGLGEEQIRAIEERASDLMQPIKDAMSSATGEVRDVELGTPESWRDLAWAFGLKLQASQSTSFEAILHGSGIQSVLAYSVLELLDTSLGGSFGWRRGAIWAVEEPESFLHANLQAALAGNFSDYASSDRLQILLTTHSPAFLGVSDEGIAVEMEDSGRSGVQKAGREDLLMRSQRAGVTPFAHPLHTGPPKPLLLVEGSSDRDLLKRAYVHGKVASPYEIVALEDLEPALTGGAQRIRAYLDNNRTAIEARPLESPIVVLLDWECAPKDVALINKALKGHATSLCSQMPGSAKNPELADDFVGIEGFLSTDFIEAAGRELGLPLSQPASGSSATYRLGVKRADLRSVKPGIHGLLRDRDDAADLRPLIDLLPWINGLVTPGQQLSLAP